ncbi:hypothetical protein [Xanthomonas phage RTH11]|nr:hypothetical protein [Xanthomonas phage RTH11]
MGHVTRHEVGELIEKFKNRVMPKSMALGMPGLLYAGINAVEYELKKTTGAPEPLLRNYARVLKHYIEAPVDPKNINYANTAIHLVGQGADATAAIKKARKTYEAMHDPKRIQKEAKAAMQRIVAEEQRQQAPQPTA